MLYYIISTLLHLINKCMFREIVTSSVTLANSGIVIGGNIAPAVSGLTVKGDISATGKIFADSLQANTVYGTSFTSNSGITINNGNLYFVDGSILNTKLHVLSSLSAKIANIENINFNNKITKNGSSKFVSLSNIEKGFANDGDMPVWSQTQNIWIPSSGKKGSQIKPDMSGIMIVECDTSLNSNFADNTWQSLSAMMQALPAARRTWDYYFLSPDISKITLACFVSEAEILIARPIFTTDVGSLNKWSFIDSKMALNIVTLGGKPSLSNYHSVIAGDNDYKINFFDVTLNQNKDLFIKIRKTDSPTFGAAIFLLDGV